MFKSFSIICTFFTTLFLVSGYAENDPKDVSFTMQPIPAETKIPRKSPVVKAVFSPFTGRIKGDKVRLRLHPDLESSIIRELDKEELLAVVDQEGDFWVVEAPDGLKAFVFRGFIIDNVVEGNRVNVRLEPDLEAPIIGHLNAGDKIKGEICPGNKKWLEITPPSNTHFYIAKEFVEFAGGHEFKQEMARKKETALQLLTSATDFAISEMDKPFEEMNFELVKGNFQNIIHNYSEFSENINKAKEALAHLQEDYTQKRIAYLEAKAGGIVSPIDSSYKERQFHKESLQTWYQIENGLYTAWTELNQGRTFDDYYEQQRLVAASITGIVEPFISPKKNKPGDFIVKHNNISVACIYSTKVDLNAYVGKKVTLIGSPRSNHNFAFPAFFVHAVE